MGPRSAQRMKETSSGRFSSAGAAWPWTTERQKRKREAAAPLLLPKERLREKEEQQLLLLALLLLLLLLLVARSTSTLCAARRFPWRRPGARRRSPRGPRTCGGAWPLPPGAGSAGPRVEGAKEEELRRSTNWNSHLQRDSLPRSRRFCLSRSQAPARG